MPDVLTTGSVVAGYRIVRLIGRGATGGVYLADDPDGQQVALKVLIPELARNERFRERFLREARIAASLEEPHVVPTFASGNEAGMLYLVMRFVDGLDLREILKRQGPLGAERAVDLVGQIAGALDSAHARGLVHRDVKPGNVLVQETDTGEHAYLCDFGLARHLTSVDSLTGERAFVGTIAYISPEQIEGAAIDARADVYSLGCMLFECLTGEAPFARESEVAAVYAHMHEPPPRASDLRPGIPEAFDSVIAKALAKAPDDRFQSCGKLARAGEAALHGEEPHGNRPRRRVVLAVAAVAVAGVTAGIVLHGGGNGEGGTPPRLAIAPHTMGLIDATTHKVVGRITFAGQPWDVVFGTRQAWVLLGDERRVARVDLASRKVLSSTRLPFAPGGIATDGDSAWVTEDAGPALVRLDATTGQIAKRFTVPIRGDRDASPTGIAFGAGSVWVARGAETVRVDPASGNVVTRILTPLAATSIVFAEGAVWVASGENGRVVKIDPATDKITASTPLHATITDLAVANGSVWVSIVPDNVVYRLSPDDGSVLATMAAGPWPAALSAGDGLWVADAKGRQIARLDGAGGRDVVPLSGPPLVTRSHGGLLWTSAGASEPVAPASGQTLRILVDQDHIDRADPAQSYWPVSVQLAYATCVHLLNYPDAPGAAGRMLRPEVATAPPDISADGRTYTFRIRPGFRFSPPSGQAVTAETFKATIERAGSPKLVGRAPNPVGVLLSDVVGATAYAAGKAPHIAGIKASGATLTIRLTRAAGDLSARLRSSFFCPVPVGTLAVPGGGKPTPIPMAGPYRVVSARGGQVVLERNPNYTGGRPRRIERIVYTDGFTPTDAISRVEHGSADYVSGNTLTSDTPDALMPGGALDTAFGLSSRAGRAGGARYLPSPAPGIDGIAFNTRRPLFRDARMRRAVAYALDRRALAAVYDEQPTDRLVPAAIGGPAGNIAYSNEPDLATARRLAGRGARRNATLYGCGPPSNKRIAQIIRSNLAGIGIDVRFDESLRCLTGPEPEQLAAADIQLISGADDVLDPASFVELPLGNRHTAPGYWRNARLRTQIENARATRGRARSEVYARLEQTLVRDAVPVAVYGSFVSPEFFSARVGCTVSQGAFNFADLGALCLHS